MSKSSSIFVPFADISLNVKNFRHKQVESEPEAIKLLLSNEKKHKVLDLAEDIIAQSGMDPSSKLIVSIDPENKGKYIALEGNRRITALKSMNNPELAKGTPLYAGFKKLSPKFLKLGLAEVECVVLSEADAKIWIKRKHYTGMGGKGTLRWGAMGTARSDAEDGKLASWLIAINFLEENGIETDAILDGIEDKTTSVSRVLDSGPNLKNILGITISKDGSIQAENGDEQCAITAIKTLMEAMARPEFKEPDVTNSELQGKFIGQFVDCSCRVKQQEDTGENDQNSSDDSKNSGANSQPASNNSKSKKSSTKSAKPRKHLAKKGLVIPDTNLAAFYAELCKLPVQTYLHCASAIIRVFLEKSSVVFLNEMNIAHPDTSGNTAWIDFSVKLRTKVEFVLKEIDPNNNNAELKYAKEIADGKPDGLHSLNMLNDYIHNHKALPAASEIITTWDRLHPYFEELFDTISNGSTQ